MLKQLPVPRTGDPRDAPSLRWGILGPGWIAERFVAALARHTTQRVTAVGSRDDLRAQQFADRFDIPVAHGSYQALLNDPTVDVVYVSTPHPAHHRCAVDAIAAGKHVLVEKPLALNAVQGREIAEAAAAARVFAGEAMWTRFLPKFDVIRQILDDGMLGPVRTVIADHGEYFTPDHRIFDPALAGGPLLDLGTYPIAFANWVLGRVDSVAAVGQSVPTGRSGTPEINGQISAVFGHARGAQSLANTTILADTPTTAVVAGVDGTMVLPGPFYQPGSFSVRLRAGSTFVHDETAVGHSDALHFCPVDAARDIVSGAVTSSIHPLSDAIETIEVMDRVRAALGITFVDEAPAT